MNTIKRNYISLRGNFSPQTNAVFYFSNNTVAHNLFVAHQCLRLSYGLPADITNEERILLNKLASIMENDRKIYKGSKRNYITEAIHKESNRRIDIVADNPFEEIEIVNKNDKKKVLDKYKELGVTVIKVGD